MDSTIIIASNQQIGLVFLANSFIIYSTLKLSYVHKDILSALSFILASSSLFMSFGYLMLYTSTYERTGSYQKAFNLCNNLAFGSSILTFLAIFCLISTCIDKIVRAIPSLIIWFSIIIPVLGLSYTLMVGWEWYQML